MADGVIVAGNSAPITVATDDAGAAGHVQLVKLAYSADGVATLVTATAAGLLVDPQTKTEDSVAADGDRGIPMLVVRRDTAASGVGADGDYAFLAVDSSGRLHTNVGVFTPGTAAANLGKAEDAAHASGDTGVSILAVRRDTAVHGVSADGDYATLNVDANGKLWTNAAITSFTPGTGATDLGKAEDAVHATGDVGVQMLAVRRDTAASGAGADGDYATINVDANGRLHANAVISTITPGTGAGNLGKAEDSAHASGDTGVAIFAVRRDSLATSVDTDGDYQTLSVDSTGRLYCNIGTSISASTEGPSAEDAVLSGNPLRIGIRAHSTIPTKVSASNDIITPWATLAGAQVMAPHPVATAAVTNVASSATAVTVLAADGDRKGMVITNNFSGTPSVENYLYLKFGSGATTTSWTYKLAYSDAVDLTSAIANYTGIVTGVWDAAHASASAVVTSLSA